jgi:hypothetical protein
MFMNRFPAKKDRSISPRNGMCFLLITARYLDGALDGVGYLAGSCASHPLPTHHPSAPILLEPQFPLPSNLWYFGSFLVGVCPRLAPTLVPSSPTHQTHNNVSQPHTHFETAHILLQRRPRTSSQQRIKLLPFGSSLKTAHRLELIDSHAARADEDSFLHVLLDH